MRIEKIDGEWWIIDTPEGVEPMGPYRTKAEAEEDRRGVERCLADLTE